MLPKLKKLLEIKKKFFSNVANKGCSKQLLMGAQNNPFWD